MEELQNLSQLISALPRAKILASKSDLLFTDQHGELIGEINEGVVTVYQDYTHYKTVLARLKKTSYQVKLQELDMNDVTRILYDEEPA